MNLTKNYQGLIENIVHQSQYLMDILEIMKNEIHKTQIYIVDQDKSIDLLFQAKRDICYFVDCFNKLCGCKYSRWIIKNVHQILCLMYKKLKREI